MTDNPMPQDVRELVESLRCQIRPRNRAILGRTIRALDDAYVVNAVLANGFRTADRALCHAIQTGFYCGEGILETLAETRAALKEEN